MIAETVVLPTDTPHHLAAAADRAIALLKDGHPVAMPTETVYGLAANALRPNAVARVFEIKQRPSFDPLICHLPDLDWLNLVTRIPESSALLVERLIEALWPGPLTLVLPKRDTVPDIVTAGLPTVAVRMTVHPVFREVLERFGKPLAAPSANRFGSISPTAAEHVVKELGGRVPLVLDGGTTLHGIESTIVAVDGDGLRLLRSGPIAREELSRFGPVTEGAADGLLEAPGQMKSHYAPNTPLELIEPWQATQVAVPLGKRAGLLAWDAPALTETFVMQEMLSHRGDLREAAATLFSKLRKLDEAGLDIIYAVHVPESGLGHAIMDRLRKAAAHE
jgi:L-threonylcarbamoyladenylate synthase